MDKKVAMYKLIEQWKKSNVSRSVFAEEHGIKRPTFEYWYKKYTHEKMLPLTPEPGFVEISAAPTKPIDEITPRVELVLSGGVHIKIY